MRRRPLDPKDNKKNCRKSPFITEVIYSAAVCVLILKDAYYGQ